MSKYDYYLAFDDGGYVIRDIEGEMLERFDSTKNKWVADFTLCEIYFGGIRTRKITEQEAINMLRRKV